MISFLTKVANLLVSRIYRRSDYLDAYAKHTDLRVRLDPHEAIGGEWEEIGHKIEQKIKRELRNWAEK